MPTCGECVNIIPEGDRFCGKCGAPVGRNTRERGAVVCQNCGSRMRRGELFADREVTCMLGDPEEERFVSLFACTRCGVIRLFVDYDTEVEQ